MCESLMILDILLRYMNARLEVCGSVNLLCLWICRTPSCSLEHSLSSSSGTMAGIPSQSPEATCPIPQDPRVFPSSAMHLTSRRKRHGSPSATTAHNSVSSNTGSGSFESETANNDSHTTHQTGDVVHLKPLGQHIIILGSAQAAFDLLDKRSAIYSDRPRSPIVSL